MDRRRIAKWAVALALGGAIASDARAGAVTFSGNVETDMPVTGKNGVNLVPGLQPNQVAQDSWITQQGWTNGWVIKDMRLDYNKATDSMQVGVNFYSIAGAADGNPAGVPDPRTIAEGGSDPASLGGRKSITVEFAPNSPTSNAQPGTPVVVAGVPENKPAVNGTGTDGFTVATYKNNGALQANYGTQINSAMGNLAFDPSPAHPDFEFTIKNWSQFSTLAGPGGFWVSGFAGSPDDVVAGESKIPFFHIPAPQQQQVPEPTTILGWAVMAGSAAWALRRKGRAADRA